MSKRALAGAWVTCVLLSMHSPAFAATSSTDIVLRATDASNLHGNWTRASDPTSADQQRLTSVDNGWSTTDTPLASPSDYFEMTFAAPANTAYHVWLRLRAGANSKWNDSVWVQFSDAVDP